MVWDCEYKFLWWNWRKEGLTSSVQIRYPKEEHREAET